MSSGRRLFVDAFHALTAISCSSRVSSASPATCRAVRIAVAVSSSVLASSTICLIVLTEWPSFTLASQMGYQIFDANSSTFFAPSCRSTTSRSLYGASSPRPYPPMATRAARFFSGTSSMARSQSSTSHSSVARHKARAKGMPCSGESAISSLRRLMRSRSVRSWSGDGR